jgi:hypothetical protein
MYIKVKYDIPLSEYDIVKKGTLLEVDTSWSEYPGFVAARYRGGHIYFNVNYLDEVPALVECI